ncbi:MAG: hypothetical protein V3R94_12020 [Acidobacteriota bacterium]
MSEKKIILFILIAGFLATLPLTLGQTASDFLGEAETSSAAGDYPAAINAYQKAITATANADRKGEIQETLDKVTKAFFIALYDQALQTTSRDEKVRLLVQAGKLEIREWLGTSFEETLRQSQRLINDIFDELKVEAESTADQGNYPRAISLYDQARALDGAAFERRGLEPVYQRYLDQIQGGIELVAQGEALLSEGKYQEAAEKFLEAQRLYPDLDSVHDGLIRANALVLVENSKDFASASQFIRAERALEMSLESDQTNEEAARLLTQSQSYRETIHQGRLLYQKDSCKDSQQAFGRARGIDRPRFQKHESNSVLGGDCSSPLPLPESEIREALLDIFDGHAEDSIEFMERLREEMGEGHLQISVLLGVAYGYSAFMSSEKDPSSLESAKEQFRTVLRSQPDYQLSERLFSPRILQLVEEIRSEGAGQ